MNAKLLPVQPIFRERNLALLLGVLTAFDPLTIDMYLPAFGDAARDLHTSIASLELSVSVFFVGMALGQLVYGPLADRFGRKPPLIAGMSLYLLATLGCAFSSNIETFVALRFLQALGGCAGMVISRTIIRDLFVDARSIASFLSNMALIMGLAPILAPTLGASINAAFGWRAIFYALAGANILTILAVALWLPETLVLRGDALPISKVLRNYRTLLSNRDFIGYLIPDAALRAGMFAYIAGSPFVFISLLHIPQHQYGFVFGANALGLMLATQINRRLLHKWPPDVMLQWGVRIAACASFALLLLVAFMPSKVGILFAIFLYLSSLNFVSPNSIAQALAAQSGQTGTASALYGSLQWSLAFLSSLFVSHLHNDTAWPMVGVMFVCGMISLVGRYVEHAR